MSKPTIGTTTTEKTDDYECCIKCGEPVRLVGTIGNNDGTGDGWEVSKCDFPPCERYGLVTTVTK